MTKKEVQNDDSHTLMVLERRKKEEKNFQKYLELKRSIHSKCKMKTRNKSLIKSRDVLIKFCLILITSFFMAYLKIFNF